MKRLLIIVFLIIISTILFWPVPILEIYSLPNRTLLLRNRLPKTGVFQLQYIHSWDKTPVWDIFKVNKLGNLILDREEYLWMGAGLESYSEADMDFNGERVSIRHNKNIKEFQLAVGTVANHRLIIDNNEITLDSIVEAGKKIIIKTRLLPRLIFYLKGSEILV